MSSTSDDGTDAVSNLWLDITCASLRPCWLMLVGICFVSRHISGHHVTGTTWLPRRSWMAPSAKHGLGTSLSGRGSNCVPRVLRIDKGVCVGVAQALQHLQAGSPRRAAVVRRL